MTRFAASSTMTVPKIKRRFITRKIYHKGAKAQSFWLSHRRGAPTGEPPFDALS
jgi:hypothetical protein